MQIHPIGEPIAITSERLRAIALDISCLPEGAAMYESAFMVEDVGRILQKHDATFHEFQLLDDTPGRLGYNLGNGRGWHWKLRRWRNQPRTLSTHPWRTS